MVLIIIIIMIIQEPGCKINCLAFPDEGACKRFKASNKQFNESNKQCNESNKQFKESNKQFNESIKQFLRRAINNLRRAINSLMRAIHSLMRAINSLMRARLHSKYTRALTFENLRQGIFEPALPDVQVVICGRYWGRAH